jgi:hypothetical protein
MRSFSIFKKRGKYVTEPPKKEKAHLMETILSNVPRIA